MRNETTLQALADQLQRNCGDELAAAQAVGVSLMFVNQWRKDDKQVHETLTEAGRVGSQGLVSAAIKRAVHGVEEDVWFKGEAVGTKMVYSDGLLQTLLKAKVPEFAKDSEGSGPTINVNVANLMPRATSYDQWLEMKQRTLEGPKETDNVVDAEYVVVPEVSDVSDAAKAAAFLMREPESVFAGIDL